MQIKYFFGRYSAICVLIIFFSINNISLTVAYGNFFINEQILDEEIISENKPSSLLTTSIFKVNDQTNVLVKPLLNDRSTNIAFYMKCPSEACPNNGTLDTPVFIFSAENLGHGELPFSDYWAPPFPNDYIAIEYKNDQQQFSCSSVSFNECINNPNFLQKFHFSLLANNEEISDKLLALNDELNNVSPKVFNYPIPTVSSDLLLLSISLSSTTISSNLENGLLVTASFDDNVIISTSSVFINVKATSTDEETKVGSTTQADEKSSLGKFMIDIVESVFDLFTTDSELAQIENITIESTSTVPTNTESSPIESISETSTSSIPNIEIPFLQVPTTEPQFFELTKENELQSSVLINEISNHEIVTTEF